MVSLKFASTYYLHYTKTTVCTHWSLSQYKDCLSQAWDCLVKDKTVARPSYLKHGDPHTGKTTSLYWDPHPPPPHPPPHPPRKGGLSVAQIHAHISVLLSTYVFAIQKCSNGGIWHLICTKKVPIGRWQDLGGHGIVLGFQNISPCEYRGPSVFFPTHCTVGWAVRIINLS